ncbi:MAG: hypothetical protein OCD01_10885 [Fibrobacterales bacterium]
MKQIITSFLFFCFLSVNLFAVGGVLSGSGTLGDPYLIEDYEDLKRVNNNLSAHYRLKNVIDASMSRTDNNDLGFEPIGLGTAGFSGSLDGNGFYVQKLFINRPNASNLGVFSLLTEGSKVINFGVFVNATGDYKVGGIAGESNGSLVVNCFAQVDINASGSGGLIGSSIGTVIKKSFTTGNIKGNSSGGLVGYGENTEIENTYSFVDVFGSQGGSLIGSLWYNSNVEGPISSVSYSFGSGQVIDGSSRSNDRYSSGKLSTSLERSDTLFSNCYWDNQKSKHIYVAGVHRPDLKGLPTSLMKSEVTYINWSWGSTWIIEDGLSYPGLISMNNPPIGISDLATGVVDTLSLNGYLENDFDHESGNIYAAKYLGKDTILDTLYYYYTPGELLSSGDTLWGSYTYIAEPIQYIPISNYNELNRIGRMQGYPLNGIYKLVNDVDASESYLDESNMGFEPIGSYLNPFVGTFIGNGFRIKNLYINRPEESYVGLFSFIDTAATIYGVGISANITAKERAGIIAGAGYGTIIKASVTGRIHVDESYVGGIISTGGIVIKSYSSAVVSGQDWVGGIGAGNGIWFNNVSAGVVNGGGLVGVTYFSFLSENVFSGYAIKLFEEMPPIYTGSDYEYKNSSNYWNSQNTWHYGSIRNKTEIQGLNSIEFTTRDSFANFDFDATWCIQEGVTHPYLQETVQGPIGVPDVSETLPDTTNLLFFVTNDIYVQGDTIELAQFLQESKMNESKDSLLLFYRPGVKLSLNDTLWGSPTYIMIPYDTL